MPMPVYNPGCALMLYKPDYAERVLHFLNTHYEATGLHAVCCQHDPQLQAGTLVINTCPGCNRRFSSLHEGVRTVSLWEILAESKAFPFPDHHGLSVSVHDACPVRTSPQVHTAIRALLARMRIAVVETRHHGTASICCGDSVYRADMSLPLEKAHAAMRQRARSMPCEDVCVYCVSCIKSMHIGGKKPKYILDLLFAEPTEPQVYDTVEWHRQLQAVVDAH